MTTQLDPYPGGLRAALTEADWRALAGPAEQLPVPLRPFPGEAAADPGDPALRQAAGLLTTPQPFRAVVSSTVSDGGSSYGVLAALAADGAAAVSALRALAPGSATEASDAAAVVAAEGVQLRAYRPDRLVAETLFLFPPDPAGADDAERWHAPVVTLAAPDARALSRAVADDDGALLSGVAELNGWDEVPPVLVSLAERVRATVTLSLQRVGLPTLHATWLQCDLGWVHTSARGDRVRHQLRSRTEIGDDLVRAFAGAYAAAARAAGEAQAS